MIAASLLLLLVAGPPYYERPVDPSADLEQLRSEVRMGTARPAAWLGKLQIYLALGELQEIPELVELLATTFPEEPVFLEAHMMFLGLAQRYPEAVAEGERILRDFPEHQTIRVNLGRIYLASGERSRGVNLLLAGLGQGPIRVEDWSLLLQGLGIRDAEPEKVVDTLRRKATEHPEIASLRYVLVVALTRLGRYAEAREILEHSPELADHPDLQLFVRHTEHLPSANGKVP